MSTEHMPQNLKYVLCFVESYTNPTEEPLGFIIRLPRNTPKNKMTNEAINTIQNSIANWLLTDKNGKEALKSCGNLFTWNCARTYIQACNDLLLNQEIKIYQPGRDRVSTIIHAYVDMNAAILQTDDVKRVAFFDFDGCLVAPMFKQSDGKYNIGFLGYKYDEFMNNADHGVYRHTAIVRPVHSFAVDLHSKGWTLNVLTGGTTKTERHEKRQFVDKHFNTISNIFKDVMFVQQPGEKVEAILAYAKEHDIKPENCLLVEDNYVTLLRAAKAGIKVMSVAHVITHQEELLLM